MKANRLSLGQKIAYLRKNKGLTQAQLAEKMSVSTQAVSKWETDQTAPDISLLYPLAKELDTTVDYLLSDKEELPETRYIPEAERDTDSLILKIRVLDNEDSVNVNIPFLLIKEGLSSGMPLAFNLGDFDFDLSDETLEKVVELIENGTLGKLVEVKSSDGSRVEIVVE